MPEGCFLGSIPAMTVRKIDAFAQLKKRNDYVLRKKRKKNLSTTNGQQNGAPTVVLLISSNRLIKCLK
jgi:hypothetical protein